MFVEFHHQPQQRWFDNNFVYKPFVKWFSEQHHSIFNADICMEARQIIPSCQITHHLSIFHPPWLLNKARQLIAFPLIIINHWLMIIKGKAINCLALFGNSTILGHSCKIGDAPILEANICFFMILMIFLILIYIHIRVGCREQS